MRVFQAFGFIDLFCSWINVILHYANLSICVNGNAVGYFKCKRGVRQGDPLSPLLFCLAEEVLSRGITKLVNEGKLQLMLGPRGYRMPSHILYADGIMLFCRASKQNLVNLMELFRTYELASGQVNSSEKSKFYAGSISAARSSRISDLLGFSVGCFPLHYLSVPLFKGKPRRTHLAPIADKVKDKLSSWKGKLLSIMGRVELVKSVMTGMLLYSMRVYAWPANLLNYLNKWIGNFVWSGDICTRKVVTVAWKQVCLPISEGGLGIRFLKAINKTGMLSLAWELLTSNSQWSSLIRARAFKGNKMVLYHISSSIWFGVRNSIPSIEGNTMWQIGNGRKISFWHNRWLSSPVVDLIDIPTDVQHLLESKVSDFILNGKWSILVSLISKYPRLQAEINQVVIPTTSCEDQLRWCLNDSGILTFKDAYKFSAMKGLDVSWSKFFMEELHSTIKIIHSLEDLKNKMPTDENLWSKGCVIVSVCSLCGCYTETTEHLFLKCDFARKLWCWFGDSLSCHVDTSSFMTIISLCSKDWSSQALDIVAAGIINVLWSIWHCKNKLRFDNKRLPFQSIINLIVSNVSLVGNSSSGCMSNSISEFELLRNFKVNSHPRKARIIKEVMWHPPIWNMVKCNTDGAARGSEGVAACGGLLRDMNADFLGCFYEHLDSMNAFWAELIGAMQAIEIAHKKRLA